MYTINKTFGLGTMFEECDDEDIAPRSKRKAIASKDIGHSRKKQRNAQVKGEGNSTVCTTFDTCLLSLKAHVIIEKGNKVGLLKSISMKLKHAKSMLL